MYNPTITLDQLQDDKYYLVQNDSELSDLLENIGLKKEYREEITGAILSIGDGEYLEVYLSESSRYYDLSAWYHPLPFYLPTKNKKGKNYQYLPDYWKFESY